MKRIAVLILFNLGIIGGGFPTLLIGSDYAAEKYELVSSRVLPRIAYPLAAVYVWIRIMRYIVGYFRPLLIPLPFRVIGNRPKNPHGYANALWCKLSGYFALDGSLLPLVYYVCMFGGIIRGITSPPRTI